MSFYTCGYNWYNCHYKVDSAKDFCSGKNSLASMVRKAEGGLEIDVWIDASQFNRRKAATWHCGEHARILQLLVEDERFPQFLIEVKKVILEALDAAEESNINVMVCCPKGKHRSLAADRCFIECMKADGFYVPEPVHLSKSKWQIGLCDFCKKCETRAHYWHPAKQEAIEYAVALWKSY